MNLLEPVPRSGFTLSELRTKLLAPYDDNLEAFLVMLAARQRHNAKWYTGEKPLVDPGTLFSALMAIALDKWYTTGALTVNPDTGALRLDRRMVV